SIRLATKDLFKNKNGDWVDETQWHTLVVWGNINNMIEKQCQKGTQILAEGKIVYREYEDNNGDKRQVTEIKVGNIVVMNKSRSAQASNTIMVEEILEEDLPF